MNRTCKTLLQALLAGTAITQPGLVGAGELPTGATTVYGGVGISTPSANQMTIQQTTPTAIVNWQGFSVGAGSRVDINQPSSSSALLNRVTGSATSTIAGQINANGQVYLVNPNGIAITSSGSVKAGAFVASTLDISDQDFASGKRTFRGTGQSAAVSNQGTIEIQRGGYAALLGGKVDNSGVISVPMGKVGLGAGEQATLDFSGDGFLQVAIPSKSDGSDQALIQHSGKITAQGGQVVMQVATARAAARNAINLSGLVEARSVGGRNGAIVLGGGEGGTVTVSGRLDTSARGASSSSRHGGRSATRQATRGGDITVTGDAIRLQGAALLADGQAGGGTIRVGGGFQGQGNLQRASTTSVDAATTISANAGRTGNGGNVVLWSDGRTDFAGLISATGGSQAGNGGQAEVSSKGVLAYDGTTILTAAKGTFGTLLLDPYNVVISNGTDTNPSGFSATANDSVINASRLQNALSTASVVITTGGAGSAGAQAGDITVAAPVSWGTGTGGQPTTLTLSANRTIAIDSTLTINGSGGLILNTKQGDASGLLSFGPNGTVNYTGGSTTGQSLVINNTSYTLINSATNFVALFDPRNLNGNYALAADVNAANLNALGVQLSPIGTAAAPFGGSLEGLGHTISGLQIVSAQPNVGLFGYTRGATIENLRLDTLAVTSTYAGTGIGYVGGLVGYADGSVISGVKVTGNSFVRGSTVSRSGSYQSYTGGLVGTNTGTVRQSSIADTVTVTGGNASENTLSVFSRTGGLIGSNDGGNVSSSYSASTVNGGGGGSGGGGSSDTGGLVGYNSGSLVAVYASGRVNGGSLNRATINPSNAGNDSHTGGLVGQNDSTGTVQTAYASGAVVAGGGSDSATGGLIGQNRGAIGVAYATGSAQGSTSGSTSVPGDNFVGGLIGDNSGTVTQTYATGRVTPGSGTSNDAQHVLSGGLVGSNSNQSASNQSLAGSFWDTDTTGQGYAASQNNTGSGFQDGATNLTTAQFQSASFVPLAQQNGWRFDTTWAPPSAGHYPELYAINPVIYVTPGNTSRVYGDPNPAFPGTFNGGPGAATTGSSSTYVFDPSQAGGPSATNLLTTNANTLSDVGSYQITPITSPYVSFGGVNYRVIGPATPGTLTVSARTITITPDNQSKTAGTTFTFGGVQYAVTGLPNNGDQVSSVTLTSDGAPANAPVGSYGINLGNVTFVNAAGGTRSAADYVIVPGSGTLTVTPTPIVVPPVTPPVDRATQASNLNNARVTPNITTILPNFSLAALSLADTLDLNGGGGPTLGVGQLNTVGDGSSTRAGAQNALASIQRASNALEDRIAACDSKSGSAPRGVANCYSDALGGFADQLDIQLQQLPPAFRGLPAVIRQAAQRVRAARTVAEARAAVNVAVVAVRKAISLLRADEPAVARIQVRQGNAIASALRTVDNRLSRAVGL